VKRIASILLVCTLLTACAHKSIFMDGYDVASGDYYLIVSFDDSLVIDDPLALAKYQQELRVEREDVHKTCFMICGYPQITLKLMHKKKGLIRETGLSGIDNKGIYSKIPKGLISNAKILSAKETYRDAGRFLKRMDYLKKLEGVDVLYSGGLPYSHVVNIVFPLRINPHHKNDDFIRATKKELRERLHQEMLKRDITEYQLVDSSHQTVRIYDSGVRRWHRLIGAGCNNKLDAEAVDCVDVKGDSFFMQINCNESCAKQIQAMNPLTWMPMSISQRSFIDKVAVVVEEHNLIADDYMLLWRHWKAFPKTALPTAKNYLFGSVVSSERDSSDSYLEIYWRYDLQYLLNHSIDELAQPSHEKDQ